jgi:hypothetical protein
LNSREGLSLRGKQESMMSNIIKFPTPPLDGEETLSDGEMLDRFGDMLTPEQIVAMLDRKLWPKQVAGVRTILSTRALRTGADNLEGDIDPDDIVF